MEIAVMSLQIVNQKEFVVTSKIIYLGYFSLRGELQRELYLSSLFADIEIELTKK